ncbi:MAG: phosphate ABC transporter permease subunit PstC [Chlamydiae bacterium]|nr:phosphate ABC transporter permease subunit PstC [Chlamydiota bacterium]MBI3266448.1 phosphate ABC transporter permease subunit PstC [Chlamydiota bacterium]
MSKFVLRIFKTRETITKIQQRQISEFIIEKLIFLSGLASVLFVILIFVFLLKEGVSLFKTVSLKDFLIGKFWYPISDPPRFGVLPLLMGSLWVTLGAVLIAVPLGLGCAIFIGQIVPRSLRDYFKAGVELLAAIPSVVLGFVGLVTLVPLVRHLFHLRSGLTVLSGSLMLAFMAMPTIVSIIEDAFNAVPKSYREGSFALGATQWQTIYRVLIPAAAPGILAGVMLGMGRVIGETMAVMMITGNAAILPKSFFDPARTMTATIAAEMGEAVRGSSHYFALFAIGIVLFLITFLVNLVADFVLHRKK